MAKNTGYYVAILFVFFTSSAFTVGSELREKLVLTYTKEIGIREFSGKNDGVDVEKYLESCNLKKGNPWCAAFVNWSYNQIDLYPVQDCPAYSPCWFRSYAVIYQRGVNENITPQSGDVFGIYFSNKKRIAHVGFIHKWTTGNYVITVEGNTNEAGSREGDGVYMKRRLKAQIYKVSRYIK